MTATAALPRGSSDVLDRDREAPVGATGEILQIPLELIDIDENVRKNVVGIEELAASIAEHGVRQPISVRDVAGARYAINFGQRRYLASEKAGMATIPAFVDNEARTVEQLAIHQLVENLSREDLPPLDRARAMRVVVDAGMTQAELARQLGLAASTVTNDLRLLTLDPLVQTMVASGAISPSHAKSIASLPAKQQRELAERVVSSKWSSHDLEREIKWKQDAATQEAAKLARTEKVTPKVIAMLEKAETPKDAPLLVDGDNYGLDIPAVVAAVNKAGWKRAEAKYSYGGRPEVCDCTAVRVEISGRNPSMQGTCTDTGHQAKGRDVDDEKRRAVEAERQRLSTELRDLVRIDLDIARSRHQVLALISWAIESWHEESWDVHVDHTDDELLDDIATALTAHHRTRDIDLVALTAAIKATQGPGNAGAGPDGPRQKAARAKAGPSAATPPQVEAEIEAAAKVELAKQRLAVEDAVDAGEAQEAPAITYGHRVLDDEDIAYRVRATGTDVVFLALDIERWDLAAEVGRADPGALFWDVDVEAWRGAVHRQDPQAVKAPGFGDPVVDAESGVKYRVTRVLPRALHLAVAVPQWRNGKVVALAEPSRLTYDNAAGTWRGPTVPAEQPEAVPA